MNIDIEQLRKDLEDYFGSAMFNASPAAIMDLEEVEKTSNEKLIDIAISNGFDLNDYKIDTRKRKF